MRINLKRVETAMAQRELTFTEIAQTMGVAAGTLHSMIAHQRQGLDWQPKTVGRFARALGCEVEEIILSEPARPARQAKRSAA